MVGDLPQTYRHTTFFKSSELSELVEVFLLFADITQIIIITLFDLEKTYESLKSDSLLTGL